MTQIIDPVPGFRMHSWDLKSDTCTDCNLRREDYLMLRGAGEDVDACPYVSPKLPPSDDSRVSR